MDGVFRRLLQVLPDALLEVSITLPPAQKEAEGPGVMVGVAGVILMVIFTPLSVPVVEGLLPITLIL